MVDCTADFLNSAQLPPLVRVTGKKWLSHQVLAHEDLPVELSYFLNFQFEKKLNLLQQRIVYYVDNKIVLYGIIFILMGCSFM